MQKSLVALSTIAALGLFACQPNTSDRPLLQALIVQKQLLFQQKK